MDTEIKNCRVAWVDRTGHKGRKYKWMTRSECEKKVQQLQAKEKNETYDRTLVWSVEEIDYAQAESAARNFELRIVAHNIGWPAAEKRLKELQELRDNLKRTVDHQCIKSERGYRCERFYRWTAGA